MNNQKKQNKTKQKQKTKKNKQTIPNPKKKLHTIHSTNDNDFASIRTPANVGAGEHLTERLKRRLRQIAIRRRVELEQRLLQRQRRLLQLALETIRVVSNRAVSEQVLWIAWRKALARKKCLI